MTLETKIYSIEDIQNAGMYWMYRNIVDKIHAMNKEVTKTKFINITKLQENADHIQRLLEDLENEVKDKSNK